MGRTKGTYTAPESVFITSGKHKKSFFSYKQDKDITAIASYYNVKVKTERVMVINPNRDKVERLVKITLI